MIIPTPPPTTRKDKQTLAQSLIGSSNSHYLNKDNIAGFAIYVTAGAATWSDYTLAAKLRSEDDDHIGVMFRISG